MDRNQLKFQLREHESVRQRAYDDKTGLRIKQLPSGGKVTIGVGCNISDVKLPKYILEIILDWQIDNVVSDMDQSFPRWQRHSVARQNILANMCFNLGVTGLKEFRKMWAALDADWPNYETAADEMLDSLWAIQVGARAIQLATKMRE